MIIFDYLITCICLALCFAAWKMRWLTASGSIAAFAMALVFVIGGLETFYIPLVLLVGGTLMSKLNSEPLEKKGRDAVQVLANGLIGTLGLLYFISLPEKNHEHAAFMAYLVSFSISICDTFSSEIGKYFWGKTVDILSFRTMVPGLSGGVSIQGTLGGLAGSVLSAVIAFFAFEISLNSAILVCGLGFLGMLLDSVLGSLLQAKYRNDDGDVQETKTIGNHLFKGYSWCNNDVVNFMSNLLVVLGYLVLGN